ncbi:class I SAM-dependent methyltransferase [Roseibium aggregatum]|uniref:Class I SAM-dependent methyltransferase n=1 Tax=Roseibium aggregatum TaxID=187304 RepID=A0A926NUA0_9HYPH|nr:class I SAM-dependent methyltransferase [Roseibium aggregatum]MBD1545354.1 class I SAM-dependent methyltransferase [Roseibium aggregatum]
MNRSDTFPERLRFIANRIRSRLKSLPQDVARLDETAVRTAYARWAPYYDLVFRAPFYKGRQEAVKHINTLSGHILEAGVGTGISLPKYRSDLEITGIDLSEEMLERARLRARDLPNVRELTTMDAGNLSFPDDHFDVAVAMYVITVVPDPARVMRELERVTKPGGTVILVNHFSADGGLRAHAERALERFADRLGWNTDFPKSRILTRTSMRLEKETTLAPFGLFTLMTFRKPEHPASAE